MEERYSVIKHAKNAFLLNGCPLILLSHALSKDNLKNELFLQCKFENLSEKQIKAVYISVLCYDTTNNIIQGIDNFAYLDLIVEQHQIFGDRIPVYIPDKETRNVSIIPTKVVFVDNSMWENELSKPFELEKFEQQSTSKLGKLEEQYSQDLSNTDYKIDKEKYLQTNLYGQQNQNNDKVANSGSINCDGINKVVSYIKNKKKPKYCISYFISNCYFSNWVLYNFYS